MGSAGYASKKGPARATKKANRQSQPKGGAKAHNALPTLNVAPVSTAQHLRIPTDLPVCVVDNGGWTVKYGLFSPPPAGIAQRKCDSKANECEEQDNGGETSASLNSSVINEEHASDDMQMSCMYNATAQPPHQLTVLAGDEITARMKNLGQLTWIYPLERGMICNGEAQLRVWARVLEALGVVPIPAPTIGGGRIEHGGFLATIAAARRGKLSAGAVEQKEVCTSNNCAFLLLAPPFEPTVISEGVDLMLFRELGMARVARMSGPCMAALRYLSTMDSDANNRGWMDDNTKCCCVVDSGYSFTHVVPTHQCEALNKAIRRLNVGGRVLTNLLKETVTYRQWNMMDEYHIVNDAKEKLCFVTDTFEEDMKQAHAIRKGLRWFDREYLLPDFVTTFQGSVRLPEPLQRKKELQEIQQMKVELDRLNNEKIKRELEDEVKDLANMQRDEECEAKEEESAMDKIEDRQKHKTSNTCKPKKGKNKTKRKYSKQENGIVDMDIESDEETDEERIKRLKAMREAEKKRREQESSERQALAVSVERFAIPEVLFRPSDICLDSGGIAEAIVESIEACAPMLRAAMYHNVLLVGGNAKIPGIKNRLELELRKLAPTNYKVRVYLPEDPTSYTWKGAKQFSRQPGFQERHSVDRLSWEAMKKMGMTQQEIWGKKMSILNHCA